MGIPLDEWSGSKATKELNESLTKFNEEASKQTRQLIRLTWAIFVLTVIMLAAVITQIVIALQSASL